mmetsp:Transcript_1370/g.2209  ORF Transcript_1370/g.2209 Transcript_1370/m.2209 type:complete len:111 (-) Transcript_1370:904-1236(-)
MWLELYDYSSELGTWEYPEVSDAALVSGEVTFSVLRGANSTMGLSSTFSDDTTDGEGEIVGSGLPVEGDVSVRRLGKLDALEDVVLVSSPWRIARIFRLHIGHATERVNH